MDNTIYYIAGGLIIVYLIISIYNRKVSKRRRSRSFMEGYERKDKKDSKK